MKDAMNIIITGVGGQGNVLAAKLLASAALACGYRVSVGDVYGLSQRGGSVASHIRWHANSTMPPLVRKNSLDLLLAFEPLEALRILMEYGTRKTAVVTNNHPVAPVGVQAGRFSYPPVEQVRSLLEKAGRDLWWIDGTRQAVELGNKQFLNTMMLGALWATGQTGFSKELFESVIRETVPSRFVSVNIEAFQRGTSLCRDPAG